MAEQEMGAAPVKTSVDAIAQSTADMNLNTRPEIETKLSTQSVPRPGAILTGKQEHCQHPE
jgi:hypothetical protein